MVLTSFKSLTGKAHETLSPKPLHPGRMPLLHAKLRASILTLDLRLKEAFEAIDQLGDISAKPGSFEYFPQGSG